MQFIQVIIFLSLNDNSFVSPFMGLDPRAIQSVAFDDVRDGLRLANAAMKKEKWASHIDCGFSCNRHPACRSFNFCGRNDCHLNSEDVFSIGDAESKLLEDASCKYVGTTQDEKPQCKENEVKVNIVDDSYSGICSINQKRVDSEWGPWEPNVEPSIDTPTEFKQNQTREFYKIPAHGGHVDNSTDVKPFYWIIWVKENMNWGEAKANCVALGGVLFSNIDGTTDQLQFFSEKMDGVRHWLGIYTGGRKLSRRKWRHTDRRVLSKSLLNWAPTYSAARAKNRIFNTANGLLATSWTQTYHSICDVISRNEGYTVAPGEPAFSTTVTPQSSTPVE